MTNGEANSKKGKSAPVFEEVKKAQVDPVLAAALTGQLKTQRSKQDSDGFTG